MGTGLHGDVHGLYFDPADASGRTLYICSDGGVMMTHDLGQTFDSSANKNLADFQFYSTTAARDFYGTMSLFSPFIAARVSIAAQPLARTAPGRHAGRLRAEDRRGLPFARLPSPHLSRDVPDMCRASLY